MRNKILYAVAFTLSLSLYASSENCSLNAKGNTVCKKQIKETSKQTKSISEEDLLELSPVTHFVLFQI
jgi:hypothetical protein